MGVAAWCGGSPEAHNGGSRQKVGPLRGVADGNIAPALLQWCPSGERDPAAPSIDKLGSIGRLAQRCFLPQTTAHPKTHTRMDCTL